MPTSCAVNRCTNNSNKGYAVFTFPSNTDFCQKWIAALGKNFHWRFTASQRICEAHFDLKDLAFVAGRKQLCKDAVPHRFCMCPCNKEANKKNQKKSTKQHEDHTYSIKLLKIMDHAHCSRNPSKKLQFPSNNILSYTYLFDHNYFAHTEKKNGVYFTKNISGDTRKKLDSVNSMRNIQTHVNHCPSLKNPISVKQLLTKSNMDKNQNELDTDISFNKSDVNSRQILMSKIDTLSKDNENLQLMKIHAN